MVNEDSSPLSPMMAQYTEIKLLNRDVLLLFRMGDFFEFFYQDAEEASRALGLTLTRRGKHNGKDIPMCGIPVDKTNEYLARLLSLGHKIAICDQVETPDLARKQRGPKAIIKREVVRVITPGTVLEETFLSPRVSNTLLSLVSGTYCQTENQCIGCAALDISTGRVEVIHVDAQDLWSLIDRFYPREIIFHTADRTLNSVIQQHTTLGFTLTQCDDTLVERQSAWEEISAYYNQNLSWSTSLDQELYAFLLALRYLKKTHLQSPPSLSSPAAEHINHLIVDHATRVSLELTQSASGQYQGSLCHAIDHTVTAGGSRLLLEHVCTPLSDVHAIHMRLNCVKWFYEHHHMANSISGLLKAFPDLMRCTTRLMTPKVSPRDVLAIAKGLYVAKDLERMLPKQDTYPELIDDALRCLESYDGMWSARIYAALNEDVPMSATKGGLIRPGYSAELDDLRNIKDDAERIILALQAKYIDALGHKSIRIKHNQHLGYFIEFPRVLGEQLLLEPSEAVHLIFRQTMKDVVRFTTRELQNVEMKILGAEQEAIVLEQTLFMDLVYSMRSSVDLFKRIATQIALLDVFVSHAKQAKLWSWCCPIIDDSIEFTVQKGRHPVVEKSLHSKGKQFIPNDSLMTTSNGEVTLYLITGANMGGKSTYLRQNAIIVLLSHIGSFVPAEYARIGCVDRLCSRVGASDNLANHQSTFMVEMVETAHILKQATRHSFVLFDELGRGTSTDDGRSIAWACVEYLAEEICCRTLFSTHFYELTELTKSYPTIRNKTMKVVEDAEQVLFLHELIDGSARRSYGITVANLAGLPKHVIQRAQRILEHSGKPKSPITFVDHNEKTTQEFTPVEWIQSKEKLALIGRVLNQDLDAISPRQAQTLLYQLKDIVLKGVEA